MPFVRIDVWKGRDKGTKKKLIKNVTSAVVESIGCPPEAVQVVISEVEKENWGLGGTTHYARVLLRCVLADEKFPDKK